MNNKGVTLIELLIVIVVLGIISAFAIPAVGTIIENTEKDAILADALAVENAAKLYCSQTTCASGATLTWAQLSPYVSSFDESLYVETESGGAGGTIATESSGEWQVSLERVGVASGDWEFDEADAGLVPSDSTRANVTADTD
jgi:type IV pilus assembly protein PilA